MLKGCGTPVCCDSHKTSAESSVRYADVDTMQEDCGSTRECASPDVRTTTYTFNNGSQNVQVCEDIRSRLHRPAGHQLPPLIRSHHPRVGVMHFAAALPGRWRPGSAARRR
jgi:hypothetical protein